jgi:uncharacterized protein (TIGR03067 family)
MRALQRSVWVVGVLAVGLSTTRADDKAKEAAQEMGRLAGAWAPVAVESAGMKADGADEAVKDLRYAFTKDGKFRLEKGNEVQLEGTYTVDPSKSPKRIDYTIERAAAEGWKGTTSLGIYELDGDTFRVCRTWPDNDARPTEFTGAKGTKQINSEFRRDKKK